jgi:aspartyl-tRNA(Asn)/glutamyl-tRNA(Gln) amidotransferase subunit A
VRGLHSRELNARDVATAFLERVAETDGQIGAFCAIEPDQVLRDAALADERSARGESLGPLHGVPIAIKDLIFTKSLATTGGSPIYADFVPEEDDVAVERLRAAGAIIFGKTNTAEFGFSGNQTENPLFGATRNPWDLERTPGGSSGGSAAAVAAGMVPAALGSDGGGSIRIPSSFCGLFGMKPSFGRVPLYPGCRDTSLPGFSAWESLEHIGPMTWSVADAALILQTISGPDRRDRHSLPIDGRDFGGLLPSDCANLRIAWSPDWGGREPIDRGVRAVFADVIATFEAGGAKLTEDAPERPITVEEFGAIVALDADPKAMRDLIAAHPGAVGSRIETILAREWSLNEIGAAIRARRALYDAIEGFFSRYDLFLTPAVPTAAFAIGLPGPELVDGIVPGDRARAVIGFSYPFNLTGHPAASVPAGFDGDGMPVGVQFVGGRLQDAVVLRAAMAFEQLSPWANKRPVVLPRACA